MSQSTDEKPGWPDWPDAGKRVEITMSDGEVVVGKLEIVDFFPDDSGGEVPVFMVVGSDGLKRSFADHAAWRFVDVPSITTGQLVKLLQEQDPTGKRTVVFNVTDEDGNDLARGDTELVSASRGDAHETWDGTRDILVLNIAIP